MPSAAQLLRCHENEQLICNMPLIGIGPANPFAVYVFCHVGFHKAFLKKCIEERGGSLYNQCQEAI